MLGDVSATSAAVTAIASASAGPVDPGLADKLIDALSSAGEATLTRTISEAHVGIHIISYQLYGNY